MFRLAFELHRPKRVRFPTRPVIFKGRHETWQADLVEMKHLCKWNKNRKFLLTVIDIASKFAFAESLQRKTAQEVSEAFERILKKNKQPPKHLQTDRGKEFYNQQFSAVMKKHGINHYSTHSERKASIVERFNRTLKENMYRNFTQRNTLNWVSMLPELMLEYNNRKHSSIGMAPARVSNRNINKVLMRLQRGRKRATKAAAAVLFYPGDIVRVSRFKRPVFDKGYTRNWSEELFKIVERRRTNNGVYYYRLEDLLGEAINGTFYGEELQKTKIPDYARIDQILQRKRRKSDGKLMIRVRWKGYSDRFNSWIPALETTKI